VPILSVPALKLQNRQHNLLFGDCYVKKNVFENFQKVALNITVMDDISHQIHISKIKLCVMSLCGILNVSLWLTMFLILKNK
jgi:hypothetical protein